MILFAALVTLLAPAEALSSDMTPDQAVQFALAHNREVIAAHLDVETAELDRVAAGVYPNPILSYTVGNVVVGAGNNQGTPTLRPGPFDQTVHTVSLFEVIDVWAKRSARLRAAGAGIEHRRLVIESALRGIVHAVRGAFTDVMREQLERDLSHQTLRQYGELLRISRARHAAGDISEAELRKVELEGLRHQNAVIDAEMEYDLARQKLAALLGLPDAAPLPATVLVPPPPRIALALDVLVERAMNDRPDVRAARSAHAAAEAQLAQARRDALPDVSVGLAFSHSEFQVSGDNPNSLSLTLSLPLPIFDRNQAAIGRARVEMRRADNDEARLRLQVRHEVESALRRATRARALLDVYEGGMLARADAALAVAERSYQAGALSLLELLEAQRTNLETHAGFLRAQHDLRQAVVDVGHTIGGDPT